MAEPIEFIGQNMVYKKPQNMTDEECGSLPTLRMDGQNISCWKLTPEELEEVALTGLVWLSVFGDMMPPVYAAGIKPFVTKEEQEALEKLYEGIKPINLEYGCNLVGTFGKLFINTSRIPLDLLAINLSVHDQIKGKEYCTMLWRTSERTVAKRLSRFKEIKSARIVHGDIVVDYCPSKIQANNIGTAMSLELPVMFEVNRESK